MAKKVPAVQPVIRPMLVFVAYSDCSSASRALAALNVQWRSRGQHVALRPMLWSFRQLAELRWSEAALHDALRAECLLLAMDRAEACDASVERWLSGLQSRAEGETLSAIVAIRDEELWNLSVTGSLRSSLPFAVIAPAAEVLGSVAARRPRVAAA